MYILDHIINEMKAGRQSFYMDDFFGGESVSYYYSRRLKEFRKERIDTVVGSYNIETTISEGTMRSIILSDFPEEIEALKISFGEEFKYLLYQLKLTAFEDVDNRNYVELSDGNYLKWNRSKACFMHGDNKVLTEAEALELLFNVALAKPQNEQELYHSNDILSIVNYFKKGVTKEIYYAPKSVPLNYRLNYNVEDNIFQLTISKEQHPIQIMSLDNELLKYEIPKFPFELVIKS